MDKKINSNVGMLIILILAIIVGLATWAYQNNSSLDEKQGNQNIIKQNKNNPVACSEEAKVCPDGLSVSRTGPNCEFSPCPNAQIVGGQCEYDKVPGTCKIISVTPDGNVKFSFVATSPLPVTELAKNLNGEHTDAQYIFNDQSLPIKSGDKIGCEASIETKGTCTPIIFKLTQSIPSMDGFQTYRNERLGFEMKIPQVKIKTKVIENGSIAWLVDANGDEFSRYSKQINSSRSEFEKVQGVAWAILVKEVKNDSELESFIQKRYGNECKLGAKELSNQANVFNVMVDTGNSEPGEGCFLNWGLVIKYFPEKGLVAAWDLGQAPRFFITEKNGDTTALDEEMMNSFKFIK